MNKTFEFVCKYGVLKKTLFGKYTNKLKEIIEVKTILHFDNEYIEVTLYGIDRNDGQGIHNERNILYYKNIDKITFYEDTCTLEISEEGCIDENGNELDNGVLNFLVDIDFMDEILNILDLLAKNGYFELV